MYAEIVMKILGVVAVEAEWMVGVGIDDEVVIGVVGVDEAEVGAGTGLGLGVEIEDETEVGLGVDIEDETGVVTDAGVGVGAEPKELHNC